ncbi:permease [Psychromarinibacter sp. C21-152]|uniref:Permease n=1 Tax=Psychromarinibacter sediminicola TaxID=3033385 RepID=A0AAE3T8S4_9RHOB|nr:permease [Psychromarinibacter sediminicola]MDF0600339.1 permease [Psychromarinibacter sediminicola]
MTDLSQKLPDIPALWRRADKAVLLILAIPLVLAVLDPGQVWPTIRFAGGAIAHTGVFIVFAVLAVAYMKATGAEALLARAFEGREVRMILLAALLGGLSPFCSCEVIPFIAALLAMGAPLSAVMAFWLASPLMDPAMFLITSGTLGWEFAIGKGLAAVGLGLAGGFTVKAFAQSAVFADPLKTAPKTSCCGTTCGSAGPAAPFEARPVWRFWGEADRRATFRDTVVENALFLGKWLLLAYMIEALMLRYIPADLVAHVLGGAGVMPVLLGAFVGMPAYLNGYAAVPMVDALLDQGMAQGAAMSFVLAGGVSCIPAAVAVWALVKPRVFAAYIGIAVAGAVIAGLVWGVVA